MTNVLLPENSVSFRRGVSKTFKLAVVDLCDKPVDITGSTIYMTVKREAQDPTPLITKISTNSAQALIFDAKGGIAKIFIDPTDTQTLEPGLYAFDVWVVLPTGKRYCVVEESVLELLRNVTSIPL